MIMYGFIFYCMWQLERWLLLRTTITTKRPTKNSSDCSMKRGMNKAHKSLFVKKYPLSFTVLSLRISKKLPKRLILFNHLKDF